MSFISCIADFFNIEIFSDPFKVCPWAGECAHVDGFYCTPGECVTADAFENDKKLEKKDGRD